jgi:hypothetical protein
MLLLVRVEASCCLPEGQVDDPKSALSGHAVCRMFASSLTPSNCSSACSHVPVRAVSYTTCRDRHQHRSSSMASSFKNVVAGGIGQRCCSRSDSRCTAVAAAAAAEAATVHMLLRQLLMASVLHIGISPFNEVAARPRPAPVERRLHL